MRNVIAHAGCGLAGYRLDIVGETIVSVGGVQTGHGQQVREKVLRQIAAAQLLILPLLQWDVDIGDSASQCLRVFRRHGREILTARPCQFVYLADVSGWAGQDGRDYLCHIPSVDRRGSPGPERQADRGVLGNSTTALVKLKLVRRVVR